MAISEFGRVGLRSCIKYDNTCHCEFFWFFKKKWFFPNPDCDMSHVTHFKYPWHFLNALTNGSGQVRKCSRSGDWSGVWSNCSEEVNVAFFKNCWSIKLLFKFKLYPNDLLIFPFISFRWKTVSNRFFAFLFYCVLFLRFVSFLRFLSLSLSLSRCVCLSVKKKTVSVRLLRCVGWRWGRSGSQRLSSLYLFWLIWSSLLRECCIISKWAERFLVNDTPCHAQWLRLFIPLDLGWELQFEVTWIVHCVEWVRFG